MHGVEDNGLAILMPPGACDLGAAHLVHSSLFSFRFPQCRSFDESYERASMALDLPPPSTVPRSRPATPGSAVVSWAAS